MTISTQYNLGDILYTIQNNKNVGGMVYQIKVNVYNANTKIYYILRDLATNQTITVLEENCFVTPLASCQGFCADNGVTCP